MFLFDHFYVAVAVRTCSSNGLEHERWTCQVAAEVEDCKPGCAARERFHQDRRRRGRILGRMIPMMDELGIDAHWEVMDGPVEFSRVTKKTFHNGLQQHAELALAGGPADDDPEGAEVSGK